MSLQWTLVATFLYVEVGFMIILLLPFISPTYWKKIFNLRIVLALTSYASLYFNVILVALVLLLLDAIREILKYKTRLNTSNDPQHGSLHYGPTMELVKEFRAQRNFYISGTSLFLWFVIKRLLALIINSARLIAENQALKNQAESATRTATSLLEKQKEEKPKEEKGKERKKSESAQDDEGVMKALKIKDDEIVTLNQSLKTAKIDLEAMKRQSENLTKEYDNLLKEHAKNLAKLEKLENEAGSGSGDGKKNN